MKKDQAKLRILSTKAAMVMPEHMKKESPLPTSYTKKSKQEFPAMKKTTTSSKHQENWKWTWTLTNKHTKENTGRFKKMQ